MSRINQKYEQRYFSRRQFLYGLGSTLMLPPLTSMMPKAVAATLGTPKRLAIFTTEFGMHINHLIPDENLVAPLLQPNPDVAPYLRTMNLADIPNNNNGISYVVDSSMADLYPYINLYNGLDNMSFTGHSWGTYAGSLGGRLPDYGKTIDHVIEQSPNFQSTFSGVKPVVRGINNSLKSMMFYDRKVDSAGNLIAGEAGYIPAEKESRDGKIFADLFSGDPELNSDLLVRKNAKKKYIVDRVLEDLNRLKNHSRISAEDRQTLDRFSQGMFEVQGNLQVTEDQLQQPMACAIPNVIIQREADGKGNSSVADWNQYYKNLFEMNALAWACDLSRVFVFHRSPNPNVYHHSMDDLPEEMYGSKHQRDWLHLMNEHFARRLRDYSDPLGNGSLLDNSLVMFSNEHSGRNHGQGKIPVITYGGLGGHVNTGQYMDFRQAPNPQTRDDERRRGFPIKMMMVSILEAFGITPEEYLQIGDGNGFGSWPQYLATNVGSSGANIATRTYYPDDWFDQNHSKPLPGFTKVL